MIIDHKLDATRVSTWEIRGDSSETKPTIANGATEIPPDQSMFLEMDTGEIYYYKRSTDSWEIFGG